MNYLKRIVLFIVLIFTMSTVVAQETECFDGIDNDGDGLIDVDINGGDPDCECFEFNAIGSATRITNPPPGSSSSYCFQITPNTILQTGAMWFLLEVDLNADFSFGFDVFVGANDSGADGLVLAFQNDPADLNAIGGDGGNLGFEGIVPSIGLEIDIFNNGAAFDDIPQDHAAIIIDGDNTQSFSSAGVQVPPTPFPNLEDNAYHPVTINWNATNQILTYTLDGVPISYTGDLINEIFAGDNLVRFGFTGATGGLGSQQVVCVNGFEFGDPGSDEDVIICNSDVLNTNLFDLLGGTPDSGGIWTDPNGNVFGIDDLGAFDSNTDILGTYTYTLPAFSILCLSPFAEVTIARNQVDVDELVDMEACDSFTLPTLTNGNYFTQSGGNGTMLNTGDTITTTQTIFIFEENGTGFNGIACTDESSFTITINNTPLADAPADVDACDSFTLPTLTNGNYFTQAGGNGTMLNAGDTITSTQTVFVFNPGTGSCPDAENSFIVTINNTPLADAPADVEACDSFTLPVLTNGNYFTQSGGNSTMLNAGDTITSTQIIFVFSPGTGSCPDAENSFIVTINNTPLADAPNDVDTCDSFTLPVLTNGNYFTQSGGNGTMLNAGDIITTTQTIFVFNPGTGSCPDTENSFMISIVNPPLADAPNNVEACDSFILPMLTNGNYFTQSGGNGTMLNAGDIITTTQTIFVFNPGTGSCPDAENSFEIIINNTPTVDILIDVEVCDSFELPVLNNGNYFTQPNGNGTMLNAGDLIISSQTLFVFNSGNGVCPDAESSFIVTIIESPNLTIGNEFLICNGEPIMLTADPGFDTYLWSTGETTQSITVSEGGIFNVTATNFGQNISCEVTSNDIIVIESEIATIVDIEIQFSTTSNSITIIVNGIGDYEYSIDGINFQSSNVFNNLSVEQSNATVFVRDRNGCGIAEEEICLLNFPSFFTPNGDAVFDTWQVVNIDKVPTSVIFIFDRFGKLLKQLDPLGPGWDGTFNGELMPTDDYWYTVQIPGEGLFRGHFTLKR